MRETKIYTPCLLVLLSVSLKVAQKMTPKPKEDNGYYECGDEQENSHLSSSRSNQSKIKHSEIDYSTLVCSLIADSTIEKSRVINSDLIHMTVVDDSNITRSTLEDTKVKNSEIINSNIHDSNIRFSYIKDHPGRIIDCCYKYCILEGDAPAKDKEGQVKLNQMVKATLFTFQVCERSCYSGCMKDGAVPELDSIWWWLSLVFLCLL